MSSVKYLGAAFDAAIPHSFRIPVLNRPGDLEHPGVSRTQLPLIAAAAITVHKSQGMSLEFFQALFGESELALGCTYVQLSRATALVGLVLRDMMTLKRLIGLSRSDRADQRCAFDLKCDAGAIASLKAARAVSAPGSADEIALNVAITAAEGELEQARATLKSRLDAKSQAAAAKAAAGSRKKPRLAVGAAAAGAAQ